MGHILQFYQKMKQDWKNCKICPIGKEAYYHVFGRGSIPCDIMFIGEAPGRSEDSLGQPFVGVAGHLLDSAIVQAKSLTRFNPRMFFTNLLCCRPVAEGGGNRAPTLVEVQNCAPRLLETVKICQPKLIICL